MYTHYAVGVPSEAFSRQEFQRLLDVIAYSAGQLQEALGTDSLAIAHLRGRLWFPWFTARGIKGEIEDYHRLVYGLCSLAKEYPYRLPKADSRREVQSLLDELGLDVKPRKSRFFRLLRGLTNLIQPDDSHIV